MSTYTQEGRRFTLQTPLGKDALLLTRFVGREAMSAPFHFQLDMVSEQDQIAPNDIVGKQVGFTIVRPDDSPRYFNGFISRFSYLGKDDRLNLYRAEVVPWLWFLCKTADCRIFQGKTIPQIVEQIFGDLGFSDYETSEIRGNHPVWEYCVQYRETDLNFVSRLMEQEGIFYYFRHEENRHVMVLADSSSAYQECDDNEVSLSNNLSEPSPLEMVTSWEHRYEYQSGKWSFTDYNFETPSTNLRSQISTIVNLDKNTNYEVYDYPGEYEQKGQGDSDVRLRMEQEEVGYETVVGTSICRSFSPGGKFTLTKHDNDGEAGKSYALTAVEHRGSQPGAYDSGASAAGEEYSNTFW
jgi:type VI secretion system secreted protein VgrG